MNAQLSAVKVTDTGVACAKCSGWEDGRKVTRRHASVAAVRACQTAPAPTTEPVYPVCKGAECTGLTVAHRRGLVECPVHGTGPVRVTAGTVPNRSGDRVVRIRPDQRPGVPVPGVVDRAAQTIADGQAHEARQLPVTANAQHQTPDVPAGRYAIRGTDGVVKFYRVDRPTEGKWAGRTFVSVQAGDEFHPVRNHSQRVGILAGILVDPRAATVLYGRELGVCGVCSRTLTDESSRAAGIGPVCASRF